MKKVSSSKTMLGGAFILVISGLLCKFIGAFYRIPLSNILGSEGIGIYQLIFPIFSLFLILSSGGIPAALSKLVSKCNAKGEKLRAKRFFKIAFFVSLSFSSLFSIIFLIFSKQIASLQGNSLASLGYIPMAIALVFASLIACYRGYFQGLQNMKPTAISQIIEQVGKLILGLVLAFYFSKYSLSLGVFGAFLGIAISEFFSFVFLYFLFLKSKNKIDIIEPEIGYSFYSDLKLFLKVLFPITLNALILPLILAFDSFLIVRLLISHGITSSHATSQFGIYSGIVNSLINFPTVFALAISASIIPALSFENEIKQNSLNALTSCFKIILLVSIPCILVFLLFSPNVISILYPRINNIEELKLASNLLKISCLNILFLSFIQVSTAAMQAIEKSYIPLFNLLISGFAKISLTFILVSSPFGIYGAALSNVLCYLLCFGLNFISLKDYFSLKIEKTCIFLIFVLSGITLSVMIGVYNLSRLAFHSTLSFLICGFVGVLLYFVLFLLLPIFSKEELKNIPYGEKISNFNKKLNFKIR